MDTEKVELTGIGKCILSVDIDSNIIVECEEPITELVIAKSDIDMVQGVSDVVAKDGEVIKPKKE